jgi:hypothetical protein
MKNLIPLKMSLLNVERQILWAGGELPLASAAASRACTMFWIVIGRLSK